MRSFNNLSNSLSSEAKRSHLNSLGFDAYLAIDFAICPLHEVSRGKSLPEPGSIRSIAEGVPSSVANDKPVGALWLSSAIEAYGMTEAQSAWRAWCDASEYERLFETFEAIFNEEALILELNENSWVNIPKIWDRDAESFEIEHEIFAFTNIDGPGNSVPWQKLKEYGISAVRVQGDLERNHFYGWDCDSIAVLDGDSIIGWKFVG